MKDRAGMRLASLVMNQRKPYDPPTFMPLLNFAELEPRVLVQEAAIIAKAAQPCPSTAHLPTYLLAAMAFTGLRKKK